jgi:hypothetical protein
MEAPNNKRQIKVEATRLAEFSAGAAEEEGGWREAAIAWDGAREFAWIASRLGLLALVSSRTH